MKTQTEEIADLAKRLVASEQAREAAEARVVQLLSEATIDSASHDAWQERAEQAEAEAKRLRNASELQREIDVLTEALDLKDAALEQAEAKLREAHEIVGSDLSAASAMAHLERLFEID